MDWTEPYVSLAQELQEIVGKSETGDKITDRLALVSKDYSRNEVVNLFRFVDRMMALPEELQREFKTELIRSREEGQMPFISRVEEMAKEEGRQEATRRTLREETLSILEVRFNVSPQRWRMP